MQKVKSKEHDLRVVEWISKRAKWQEMQEVRAYIYYTVCWETKVKIVIWTNYVVDSFRRGKKMFNMDRI